VGADAEEAVQSTWIVAVQRLADFRWESSLKTWLSGITLNACREIRRRRRDFLPGAAAEHDATAFHPALGAALDLKKALSSLPEGYREALILHDVEGYTHEEIARLLGIDSGTSKSQLSRARKALRTLLGCPETAGERPS
jgi:RNA polymerase sigma-70 factor (ECF subfamily)